MDLISVIIPYYNKKNYIQKALTSVKKQSYKNLEILLIFDGGNFQDLGYIKKIIKKDKRIKLIINKKNLGAGYSRNLGIKKSKGDYIAFLDSDDFWKKNKVYKQLKFMKTNSYKISHTSFNIVGEKGDKIKNIIARDLKYQDLIKSCDVCLSTVMVLKKILINSNFKFANLRTKEDYVLWLKIIHKHKIFYALNNNLTNWRNVKNSLSSDTFQKIKDGFKVYNKYLRLPILVSICRLIILSLNFLWKKYI